MKIRINVLLDDRCKIIKNKTKYSDKKICSWLPPWLDGYEENKICLRNGDSQKRIALNSDALFLMA